jgi:hypothetical protein
MSAMHDAVQDGVADRRVAEHLEMPHYLTGESLRSGSSIRTIPCMASAFRPAIDALEEDRR